MIELTERPIVEAAVRDAVAHPGAGALVVFSGTARDSHEGKRVVGLFYEAYAEMALPVMRGIADEARSQWPECRVAMVHRVGHVPIGEPSVVIAVSAPHRGECYEASRFTIDALKTRVPIWKKELYEDGSVWKANRPGETEVR